MNTGTLGTWRNPSLAYVVAELVISPYYSMNASVPLLQDSLRASYPRTIEAQEVLIESNKPSIQPLWQMHSPDQTHGVQLGTRSISLHATSYLDSSDFLRRWGQILDVIGAARLDAFVERAGLRYVDLIVPNDDKSVEEYLKSSLQGVKPDGAVSTGSMWAAGFQFDGSVVNLRTAAPAPIGLLLPPDFNPLPLDKPKIRIAAEKRLSEQNATGYIDTDCIKSIQSVFDAANLADIYFEMQKLTSKTFKSALSSVAEREWM
jgi:uncharacterized protein (TIGR04255 family)